MNEAMNRPLSEQSESQHVSARRFRWGSWTELAGLLLAIGLLVAFFTWKVPGFPSQARLATIANEIPALTLVVVGMTLVLIVGGIDLSVGSVMALSSAVIGLMLNRWDLGVGLAVAAGMGVGALCGVINGSVIVGLRVPAFIVTLGMLQVARGLTLVLTNSSSIYLGTKISSVASPLPAVGVSGAFLLAIVMVALGHAALTRTVWGRHLIAVGTNETAVVLAGIRAGRIKWSVYVLVGALAGMAGWFQTARLSTVDPGAGRGLELDAIAAVVIGGTSLMGGRGSVVASALGVILIAVLQSGLAAMKVSDPAKLVITGAVIVAAVLVDGLRTRLTRESFRS